MILIPRNRKKIIPNPEIEEESRHHNLHVLFKHAKIKMFGNVKIPQRKRRQKSSAIRKNPIPYQHSV